MSLVLLYCGRRYKASVSSRLHQSRRKLDFCSFQLNRGLWSPKQKIRIYHLLVICRTLTALDEIYKILGILFSIKISWFKFNMIKYETAQTFHNKHFLKYCYLLAFKNLLVFQHLQDGIFRLTWGTAFVGESVLLCSW